MSEKNQRSEEQWRRLLTPMEFHILREAGTERPGTGALLKENRQGVYSCRGCQNQLFRSDAKFESGCGWPSFFEAFPQSTIEREDTSHSMVRTEVICANCKSHLGHIFPDAPHTPTGNRYCMNSLALTFTPDPV